MKINDYRYKAKRMKDGKIVKGMAEGPSKAIVDQFLFENGMRAIEIEMHKSLMAQLNRITLGKIIKDKDLIFYLKQLSSLLRSGVKLNEACEILATQQTNKAVRRIYYGIYYEVNGGQLFSESMKEYPKEFPKILVSMIAVGEKTGDLEDVLTEIVDYFEKQYRLKSSIRSTLMLPIIYMTVAIGVAIFLMVGVLPQFEGMYDQLGGELPGVTVFFMDIGKFLRANGIYLLIGFIAFIILFRTLKKKSYKLQYALSYIAIRMPIFGALTVLNNLSRIASTLAQLMKNHVPLQDSLKTTYDTLDNKVYRALLVEAQKNVNGGELMSTAFEHHFASEVVFTRMMSVGERTGELGKMMSGLAQFYDEDSEIKVERMKKALEPLLLIFIYVMIVIMILAVMLPSLSLSDQLG
jgi:type IV pilus assembly protein PilC